ncbi:hypothetical protein [Bartonella raoultii]|nr:hypothetical protein [Bartonella raoultii]
MAGQIGMERGGMIGRREKLGRRAKWVKGKEDGEWGGMCWCVDGNV